MAKKNVTLEEVDAKVEALASTVSSLTVGEQETASLPEAEPFEYKGSLVKFRFARFIAFDKTFHAHEVCTDKTRREQIADEYPNVISVDPQNA